MKMILKNRYGELVLGDKGFNIISAEGLGLASKSYTTVECVDRGGHRTIHTHTDSRVITVGGDIYIKDNNNREKALRILSDDVWLTVITGRKKRKIYTKIKEFEIYNKNGGYYGFMLQLEADNPFFKDLEQVINTIYERENLVSGEFTLPCIFTKRTVGKNVINSGSEKTYPRIILYDLGGNGKTETEKTFTLVNETTGKSVTFEYETSEGEEIVIDFDERFAESSISGDVTKFLALENYLSEFYLQEGVNFINILNNTSRELSPVCFHDNNYNECL